MIHHGTMRKYTAALLDLFNGFEVQYEKSDGSIVTKNIPVKFSSREKSIVLDEYTAEQLISGNYNVLPRANLSIVSVIKADQRITNKNTKINKVQTENTFEYMYNSVPYEFTYQLDFICRGMNEAAMIVEQIAPKFNPTVNIDVWDASNLDEPTRIPVRLLDISIEHLGYDELSSNLVAVECGISLMGNFYPPIKSIERIKDFKIYVNKQDGDFFNRETILGWDILNDGSLTNETLVEVTDTTTYAPQIIDIVTTDIIGLGIINLSAIYEDKDNKFTELSFEWELLSGSSIITSDKDHATLEITVPGVTEIQLTITDAYGNYNTLSKTFTV